MLGMKRLISHEFTCMLCLKSSREAGSVMVSKSLGKVIGKVEKTARRSTFWKSKVTRTDILRKIQD